MAKAKTTATNADVLTVYRQVPIQDIEMRADIDGLPVEVLALEAIVGYLAESARQYEGGYDSKPINDVFMAEWEGHKVKVSLGDYVNG